MRLQFLIGFLLFGFLAQAQLTNPDPTAYKYVTLAEALQRKADENTHITVSEIGLGGDFVVRLRSKGYVPDGVRYIAMSDSLSVLERDMSQNKAFSFEHFGLVGDGVTENYYAFQRMANYASTHNGTILYATPGATYNINVYKAGTPKFKTNITQRDSLYVDSSGATNDTIIYTVFDTTLTLTNTYIPNGITDILWLDPQYLTIIGNGAKIHLNGAMDRTWTHSASGGAVHQSAYSTVVPFAIAFGNHVSISGLEIDGDNQETTESTPVNEGQGYGMVFRGTDYITLKDCYIHNIQTDGLYIEGTGAGTPGPNGGKIFHASTYADIENVKIWYCGRQGFTIGALHIGIIKNCDFSYTADTAGLGTQPYAMRGYAPQKGLDIEPIYEYSHSTLIRTDNWTSDITFQNCNFVGNRGGTMALSHPYTVKDISFVHCTMDNSKYNRFYNIISTIPGLNLENNDINTGTGAMYLTRDNGGEQRITVLNNRITSGGTGFITGSSAQYGALVEGNWIIGNHTSDFTGYFPTISSNAMFINNHIVLDSGLYNGTGKKLAAQIYTPITEGNTWISQMDTLPGRTNYSIIYNYYRTVDKENFNPRQAVRPYGGWDVAHSDFTAGKVGIGSIQVANGGFGKPEVKTYWLQAVPTVNPIGDTYKEGDYINITKPGVVGWDHYRCITGGDFTTGTPPVFSPVGQITASGSIIYHNGLVVSGGDFYAGRYNDFGGTSKVVTATFPNGAVYITKAVNDTGVIAFQSPFAFGLSADMIIKGSMYVKGKNANFTVSTRLLGNNTFTTSSLIIDGDSTLIGTKVRWIKNTANTNFLAFYDTATVINDKTVITLESVTLTTSTGAYMANATLAWSVSVLKSLSGYTSTTLTNGNAVDWISQVINKPSFATPPAQFNPTGGTGITVSGTYPNMTFTNAMIYHAPLIAVGPDVLMGRNDDFGGTSKLSTALVIAGGGYVSKGVNDTGLVAFKSPFTFGALTATMLIKGSMFIAGKGNASFAVSARLQGNNTFANTSMYLTGDSSLVATKVSWIKDASGNYSLAFFDTATTIVDKTVITLESITLTGAGNAYLSNAATPWTQSVLKSLSGYTATLVPNTGGGDYALLKNKPTIPAQLNLLSGTGISISGTYPNLTVTNTGNGTGGGSSSYRLPFDGVSTHYLGGDTIYHDFPSTARAAISLNLTTTGTSGAATGSYNATTGVISINVPQYTGGGGGGGTETDPIYAVNGVTLNTVQALTAPKTFPASTAGSPSLVLANSGTNYAGSTPGALWTYNQHVYAMLNGVATQIDHQAFDTSQCCTFIVNGTGSQIGANMNISGSAGVGTLFFNQAPATGSANDNVLTVSSSGTVGQVSVASITDAVNTVTVTSSSYTVPNVAGSKTVVLVNYSAGTATVVLPSAAANADKEVVIKDITTQSVTMSGGWVSDANTIASFSYGADTWHSNGTTWYMIAKM